MELDGLIGRRVSLRYRVSDGRRGDERDGRPLLSDAVGELTCDGDALTVHTRRGPVPVSRDAVVAVRAVPPAAPRRAGLAAVARLESLCADAWPASVEEPLGAWRLRAEAGRTGGAGSALAIGDPGMPVRAALDVVRAFASGQRTEPRVQVPVGSPWDRAVRAQGWVLDAGHAAGPEGVVLVAGLDALAATARPGGVELAERPDGAWREPAPGSVASAARRPALAPRGMSQTTFALVREAAGTAVGRLRATVVQDHVHLSLLEVGPAARRRGLATALVAAAAGWGGEHGGRWAVAQVPLRDSGARALADRLDFVEHHRYRYLVPPPD